MERVLRGLGISEEHLPRPLAGFSGGELTRASLARALVSQPDVLLLDEPTNHLDLGAVEWLERAIGDLGAAVVLVSHDRWFLESLATGVLELDRGRARLWPMGYSAFRRERALAIDRQGAEAALQAAEIARLERFVERFRAGTRSRQAASRQKRLDRMTRIEAPTRAAHLAFGFPRAERSGRVVIEADGVDVAVPGRTLVAGVGFTLERGQRLAVVGPNGAGKTSLVETLIGRRPAERGRVSVGHRVEMAYFSQQGAGLRDDRTVVETVLAAGDLTQTQARTLLGGFLFSGADADAPVERLSGGERRRLELVALIARGGNLLVLDEPTNHLDTESREALETALGAFDGTVVIVSHDRALIDAVATHTLSIEDGRAVLRAGGYADLLRARDEAQAPPAPRPRRHPRAARADGAVCPSPPRSAVRRRARSSAWRARSPASRPASRRSRPRWPTRPSWPTGRPSPPAARSTDSSRRSSPGSCASGSARPKRLRAELGTGKGPPGRALPLVSGVRRRGSVLDDARLAQELLGHDLGVLLVELDPRDERDDRLLRERRVHRVERVREGGALLLGEPVVERLVHDREGLVREPGRVRALVVLDQDEVELRRAWGRCRRRRRSSPGRPRSACSAG